MRISPDQPKNKTQEIKDKQIKVNPKEDDHERVTE
jgi:hypothetical protein